MSKKTVKITGYACAYTPLAILDAAGLVPYRVLPMGDAPDQAGRLLHDNLCPHVKRVLDRILAKDVPKLFGMVFMNTCDAMRRLSDAFRESFPDTNSILIDLPETVDDRSVEYLAHELKRLANVLSGLSGQEITKESIVYCIEKRNRLAEIMNQLEERLKAGTLEMGPVGLQKLRNRVMTSPVEESLELAKTSLVKPEGKHGKDDHVPLFLFGNVMPDPETFSMFDSCGARIVADDLCTGSRQFSQAELDNTLDVFEQMARAIVFRPLCARTIHPKNPGKLSQDILAAAKKSKAKGTVCYVVKFCDPYLARLPKMIELFRSESMPLLIIEGDCTLRSIGQQRTRIEAFIEMLR